LFSFLHRNVAFFAGAILAVMLSLSFYDQDILTAENAISFMAILGRYIHCVSSNNYFEYLHASTWSQN